MNPLAAHLDAVHGAGVSGMTILDIGVVRVDRRNGPSWVVREFSPDRPVAAVEGDAEILRLLTRHGYPAERVVEPDPVSVLDGRAILVTELVPSVPRVRRRTAVTAAGGLRRVGELQAELHRLDPRGLRAAGAWHHLAEGPPSAELAALRPLLDGHPELLDAIDALPDADGLPEALIHPDFVMANVVAAPDGRLVLVDWAGAGRGPRAWALAFSLWSVGFSGDMDRVERLARGYRHHLRLEPDELIALPALVRIRPTVFLAWTVATGRRTDADVGAELSGIADRAAEIGRRGRDALA